MKKSTKYFYNTLLISVSSIVVIYLVLFSFVYLNFFTDKTTSEVKDKLELFSFILTPLIAVVGTIVVFTSFRQQVRANEIQTKALKKEKKRYKADKDFDRILGILNDLDNLRNGLRLYTELNGTKEEFNGAITIDKYIKHLINIKAWEDEGKVGSKSNLPSPTEFAYAFFNYLRMVSIVCKYLINFKKYDEDAFLVLRPKFDKAIEDLELQLSRISHCKGVEDSYEFPAIKEQSALTLSDIRKLKQISPSGFRLTVNFTDNL